MNRAIFSLIQSYFPYWFFTFYFFFSTAWNDIRKITFFVIVGNVGYDEERKESISDKSEMLKLVLKKQEANMTLQLLESLSSINRQIEMMQWGRKQESSKDMLKMEATLSKHLQKSNQYH